MQQLFEKITSWQDISFPEAGVEIYKKKLLEESQEVSDSTNTEELLEECSDNIIVTFGLLNKAGLTYQDLEAAMERKFKVVSSSEWEFVGGVHKRVKE